MNAKDYWGTSKRLDSQYRRIMKRRTRGMNKTMSKAAKTRLEKSEFFHNVCDVIVAWDYYLHIKDQKAADEMAHKWEMAKLALEHITGNLYGFSRNDETVSIVNERDYSDRIFVHEAYRP